MLKSQSEILSKGLWEKQDQNDKMRGFCKEPYKKNNRYSRHFDPPEEILRTGGKRLFFASSKRMRWSRQVRNDG